MKKTTDLDIVVLAKEGNEEAFQELYVRYSKLAYFIALKTCANEADAQDIVQNAFLQVHKNIADLKEPKAFKGWLYQIVISSCKKLYRKNYRTNRHLEKIVAEDYVIESRKEFVPEKEMRFKSDQEVVMYYLNSLSGEQRLVLTLFYFEQMSIKEIADLMSVPEGTVKSRLAYGRKFLYERLSGYEKRNQEKVTFQAFDMVVIAAMTWSFQNLLLPVLIPKVSLKRHIQTPSAFSVVTIGVATVTAVTISMVVLLNKDSDILPLPSNEQNQIEVTFHEVIVGGKHIGNARDAYFELKMWAFDKKELGCKEKEDLLKYKNLYEEMKSFGGYYYDLLLNQWAPTFESLIY